MDDDFLNRQGFSPRYAVTKYRHILWYTVGGVFGLVLFSIVWAKWQKAPRLPAEKRVNISSSAHGLPMPEPPKEQPKPPPPPPPPPAEYVPQPNRPAPPAKKVVDEDAKRRKEELVAALRSKSLIDLHDQKEPMQVASAPAVQGEGLPQTLELQPQWSPSSGGRTGMGASPTGTFRSGADMMRRGRRDGGDGMFADVRMPLSPYQITPGTAIEATMARPLNSDREGPFTALVSRDVLDSVSGQHVIFPAGTIMSGWAAADLDTNEPYLQLSVQELQFQNGAWLPLNNPPGADAMGQLGVRESVNRHYLRRYGRAAVLSLITGGVSLAVRGGGGFYSYSPADAAVYGLGQVLGRQISEELRAGMKIEPTVFVPEGYPVRLIIEERLSFREPYPFHGNGGAQ